MRANMDSSHRRDVGCDMCNWFFGIYSQVYGRRLRFFSNDRTQEGYKGTFWLMDFVRLLSIVDDFFSWWGIELCVGPP